MKLARLRIDRLPGVAERFEVGGLDPGINVLVGPNASGKSSVVRAVRALLDPSALRGHGALIDAAFDHPDGRLEARRVGDDVRWTRDGQRIDPPPLPDARFLSCYDLRLEDLTALDTTDVEIARHLARELSGGYELESVRDAAGFALKRNHGDPEAKALQQAANEVRSAQRHHQELARAEERLAELQEDLASAEREAAEMRDLEAALELLDARHGLEELESQLDAFPPGMEHLHADLLNDLGTAHARRDQARTELEEAQRDEEDALQRVQLTELGDAALSEADVDAHRTVIARMRELERERHDRAGEAVRAQARLRAAREELGTPAPEADLRLRPERLHEAEQALEDKRRLDAELRARQGRIDALPEGDAAAPQTEPLREARRHLLGWLRAQHASWTGGRWLGLVFLLASMTAAAMAAAIYADLAYALTAVGVAVGLALLLSGRGEAGRRRRAREAYRRTRVAEPDAWEVDAATARLEALDREVIGAEDLAEGLRRRAELERAQRKSREEQERAVASLRGVADEVGFDPGALDASLHRWLAMVEKHDRAREEEASARADAERLASEIREARAPVAAFLAQHAAAPGVETPGAAALDQALEALAGRLRDRAAASRDLAQARKRITRARARLEEVRGEARAVFDRAGLLGDSEAEQALRDEDERALEHELRARMGKLEDFRALERQVHDARAQVTAAERNLAHRPDLLEEAARGTRDALLQRREAAAKASVRVGERHGEIGRIEERLSAARRERSLEAATKRQQAAEDALWRRYEEAQLAEAGEALLADVEQEHQSDSRPATLRRAMDWFTRFTRNRYELRFRAGADGGFTAFEAGTGMWRTPAELSSGTLAQLLLAVRVAFAVEAEQGREPLPLFLDEALTTADPERFRAVAASLRTLAREQDRQVFYLTARNEDAAFWRDAEDGHVRIVDIERLRAGERAIVDPERLSLPDTEPPPAPDGRSAEAYAVALAVPPVDPWDPPEATHLFHLLRDDLELLHRLLKHGVQRLGELRVLLHSRARWHVLDEEEARRSKARVAGVEAWFRAWRHGRGRRVDRSVLEACEAVSDTYLERVNVVAQEHDGDARRLIEALEDGHVKGFHTSKREELAAYLEDHGYLDPRDPLPLAEIRARVHAALAEELGAERALPAEARALTASLATASGTTD